MSERLDDWIDREYRHAVRQMLRSVSPTGIIKSRPGFGQVIHPRRGSIVASPVPASYDPDPDYFFHWYRDSAAVMDALRALAESGDTGAREHFRDFVTFSLELRGLDGRALIADAAWRARVREDFVRFLRSDEDLARVHGEEVCAETRVNADGTLDISSWPRPQYDGPALRALTVLRWLRSPGLGAITRSERLDATRLVRADLEFTRAHWREPCFDIWEEELGTHYYALRVAGAALDEGAEWLASQGESAAAQACRIDAATIRESLDRLWLADAGYYRSRLLASGERSAKELDISVILAVIHAGSDGPRHSVRDPHVLATLAKLDALFESEYPINRQRPPSRAPALGRYRGDVYYSGGAYYFSTLGAAELCFRAAGAAAADGEPARMRMLCERGDAYLETVRAFTPPSGDLSEQFDQRTGEQTSAKHLAWSYAALVTCVAARRRVIGRDGT
jgi:glucoamylase